LSPPDEKGECTICGRGDDVVQKGGDLLMRKRRREYNCKDGKMTSCAGGNRKWGVCHDLKKGGEPRVSDCGGTWEAQISKGKKWSPFRWHKELHVGITKKIQRISAEERGRRPWGTCIEAWGT